MKRMILAILLAATVQITTAQNDNNAHRKQMTDAERQQHRKEMQEKHMKALRHDLALSNEQFEAFAPIYAEYQKALRGDLRGKHERFDFATASDAQVLAKLNENLDRKIHAATVRKAYVEKFGTVLTPRQICKLYNMHAPKHPAGMQGKQHGKQAGFRKNGGHAPQHGGNHGFHNGAPDGKGHGFDHGNRPPHQPKKDAGK